MRSAAIVIAIAACVASAGCAVSRKSVSVDSGSKMPWLNMELMPKGKSPAPEARRISRDKSVPLEPVPAKLTKENAPSDEHWWQKLTGAEKRTPIKLPRTDLEAASANKAAAAAPVADSEPLEF